MRIFKKYFKKNMGLLGQTKKKVVLWISRTLFSEMQIYFFWKKCQWISLASFFQELRIFFF